MLTLFLGHSRVLGLRHDFYRNFGLWFDVDDPLPQLVVLLLQHQPGTTVGGAGTTVEQDLLAWRNILNCSEPIVSFVALVSE